MSRFSAATLPPNRLLAGTFAILILLIGAVSLIVYRRWAAVEQEEAEQARIEEEVTGMARAEERERLVEELARSVEEEIQWAEEVVEEVARVEEERRETRKRAEDESETGGHTEEERRETKNRAEDERSALENKREEQQRPADERATREPQKERASRPVGEATAAPEEKDVDTPEVDTETTIDGATHRRGWSLDGDLRPGVQYDDLADRDGSSETDGSAGFRVRFRAMWGPTERLMLGARLAGACFTSDCDLEWYDDPAIPSSSGLDGGQFTLDELYLQWSQRARFSIALGRLQTRFVLRGGVFTESLDRNDSNNVNVTWTDGVQAVFRSRSGWDTNVILQRNSDDGSGSIRHGPLDFDSSDAHTTYFVGTENIQSRGWVVQRGFDVSYLPRSLLADGDENGRRVDYSGLVARLALRWPKLSEGPRLRAGGELGYAPETPTSAAVDLPGSGDASGLAWNVVLSAMEFVPEHSIGLNYGRTGSGWYLSPEYKPNQELIQVRYQWRPKQFPMIEARIRRREDLQQQVNATRKQLEYDVSVRATWQFTIRKYPGAPWHGSR
jgi:cell division protein FtsN